MKDLTAIRRAKGMLEGKPLNKPALRWLIKRVATSRVSDGSIKLIYIGQMDEDNPVCMCPVCGKKGRLMDAFSLLANGFNGIKPGTVDDLDVQECGKCGALLEWGGS